ncbi:MAG: ImmA/IrrE family metallo-endopeptidase [Rhodospirillaceae bacterium]|nr:ImmA/IrrE family metallo-endopeptidase [Rhodospirillaceae bacterium]
MNQLTWPRRRLAENRADQLSRHYSSPPIPVLEIAERNGVSVTFADFGELSEKVAGFCDLDNARIYVNSKDKTERQSFTIAHELGHWILHREKITNKPETYRVLPRFTDPDSDNPLEKEANAFAACLLVPKRLLKPVLGAPISALANIFGVSRTMMEFRVKNIS